MLVLTRKLMEKLFIGEDICVTVVRLDGGQVRLGIEAPRDVAVVRAELVPERVGPKAPPPGPHCSPATANAHAQASADDHALAGPGPGSGPIRVGVRAPSAGAHGIDSRRRARSR